jgi:hypothetical protein
VRKSRPAVPLWRGEQDDMISPPTDVGAIGGEGFSGNTCLECLIRNACLQNRVKSIASKTRLKTKLIYGPIKIIFEQATNIQAK